MKNSEYKEWFTSLFASGWKQGTEQRYEEAIINCINLNGTLFDRKTYEVCYRCKGKGSYDVACGPYDYDQHECAVCKGEGCLTHKAYKKLYKDFNAKEKEKTEEKVRIETELKRIKAKLTREELEFLIKYSKCSYS